MEPFVMEIAGFAIRVEPLFETTRLYCREFWTDRKPDYTIQIFPEMLVLEQQLLDQEADEEGLKRRKFADPFLERSWIQRHVAEALIERNVLLLHGSTVAVDGLAYLFTAPCGTGKSTHTRLWREVFGERAVMVNDDKPFLRFTKDGVYAYGSPWTGKHGLGSNVYCPLKGICVLRRGTEDRIQPADSAEVREFLRQQCFVPEQGSEFAYSMVDNLLRLVPVWKMECTKSFDAARVSYEAMSNAEK